MADEWHVKWLKEGVKKWNKRRRKIKFTPNLAGVNFFEVLPEYVRANPKTSMFFEGINLSGAILVEADLSNLNFRKANFSFVDASFADLSSTNFASANFSNANIADANVDNSNFHRVKFINNNLENINFLSSDISEAIFIHTELEEILRLKYENKGANFFSSIAAYRESKDAAQKGSFSPNQVFSDNKTHKTRKTKYDVFYGTNRVPIYEQGSIITYGSEIDSKINYGICEVFVPHERKVGSIRTPFARNIFNSRPIDFEVDVPISLNDQLFWGKLKTELIKLKAQARPTIFVHGYRNTFEDAVLKTAQIGIDLDIGGGIGLFSWPSRGSIIPPSYTADAASVEKSKYLLADFVEAYVENVGDKGVNLIAHSMGCRCLLGAIEVLSSGRKKVLKKVRQIILAAADVDVGHMPSMVRHAVGRSKRITSYASEKDFALWSSKRVNSFQRVGYCPPVFVMDGIDTVVVHKSSDLGFLSHQYISTSSAVLNDVFQLLLHEHPPSERFLLAEIKDSFGSYWKMKE